MMSLHQSSTTKNSLNKFYQPREKLNLLGPKNLTNQELIAILLRTGSSKHSVLTIAKSLCKKYELKQLFSLNLIQLCQLKGVGTTKASSLLACFELAKRFHQESSLIALNTPEKIFQQAYEIKDKKQEICLALYVDGCQRLLLKKIMAIGTLNQNFLELRELMKPALNLPAAGFFLVHNHPSGNNYPSEQDLVVTRQVAQGASLLGIELIDHIIVTANNYFSFKNSGLGDW